MPTLEYNFSDQHLELIRDTAQGEVDWEYESDTGFNPLPDDNHYIRMSVFDDNGNFIDSFYSNLSGFDDQVEEVLYTGGYTTSPNPATADTVVIPNPSGDDFGLDPYPIYNGTESLDQYCVDMGYESGYEEGSATYVSADIYYVYDESWNEIQGTAEVAASVECILTTALPTTPYDVDWTTNLVPQLRIYKATGIVGETNNIFVKPNEVLEARDFEAGNYQLMFEFLHNPFEIVGDDPTDKTYFFITEISSSRKEVRLIARDTVNAQLSITKDDIDGAMQPYRYDFVLGLPAGQNIPILNYMIDTVSNPTWSSLILKLYSAVPSSITNLTQVTIEREIFTTQTEDIWYKTEDYIGPSTGIGLGQQSGFLSYEDAS